jgi:hypothetical protein
MSATLIHYINLSVNPFETTLFQIGAKRTSATTSYVTRILKIHHLMPMATMVISPSRTSSISCLNCAILCKLPHRHVNNTEPQKGTLRTNSKKGAKLFLGCFDSVREHKQYWNKWIAADGWIDHIINDRYGIPTNLKCVAADLNRAIGRHPKFGSIDTIGNTNVLNWTLQSNLF